MIELCHYMMIDKHPY